jgi:hypothetical protein
MAFIVERYLPGLDPEALVSALHRLERVTAEMRAEGTRVAYLGSAIVPDDEACFCHFEADSEAEVLETNRRAGLPCDRVVGARFACPAGLQAPTVAQVSPRPGR